MMMITVYFVVFVHQFFCLFRGGRQLNIGSEAHVVMLYVLCSLVLDIITGGSSVVIRHLIIFIVFLIIIITIIIRRTITVQTLQ